MSYPCNNFYYNNTNNKIITIFRIKLNNKIIISKWITINVDFSLKISVCQILINKIW
jgi:hypothetical protein